MPFEDNQIAIDHLKTATLTTSDLKDIVTVLEHSTSHLLMEPEATKAMERLQKLIRRE